MAVILQEEERKERNRQRMLQNAPEQAGMREKLVQQHENERRRATEFLKQTMQQHAQEIASTRTKSDITPSKPPLSQSKPAQSDALNATRSSKKSGWNPRITTTSSNDGKSMPKKISRNNSQPSIEMINPKLYTSVEIAKRAREETQGHQKSGTVITGKLNRRYREDSDY